MGIKGRIKVAEALKKNSFGEKVILKGKRKSHRLERWNV